MPNNKEELILEAYRRSEERLAVQQTMALAADQRALTFSGLLFAAAAILAGLTENASDASSLFWTSGILVVSAAFAGWSARPVDFGSAGGRFSSLKKDIEDDVPHLNALQQIGEYNDEHISDNEVLMAKNGRLMRWSYFIAIFSPTPVLLQKLKEFLQPILTDWIC